MPARTLVCNVVLKCPVHFFTLFHYFVSCWTFQNYVVICSYFRIAPNASGGRIHQGKNAFAGKEKNNSWPEDGIIMTPLSRWDFFHSINSKWVSRTVECRFLCKWQVVYTPNVHPSKSKPQRIVVRVIIKNCGHQ